DWLPTGWAERLYSWLGVRLPDILIGSLLSVIVLLVFNYLLPFDLLSGFLLGGVVAGLLGSRPGAHAALTPPRRPHHFFSLLARATLLGLVIGLFLALLSNFYLGPRLFPPFTGMIFGLGIALLTLLLAGRPPASPQAISPPGSSSG